MQKSVVSVINLLASAITIGGFLFGFEHLDDVLRGPAFANVESVARPDLSAGCDASVTSFPTGVTVELDGESAVTPATFRGLQPGMHSAVVMDTEYLPTPVSFRCRDGTMALVNMQLFDYTPGGLQAAEEARAPSRLRLARGVSVGLVGFVAFVALLGLALGVLAKDLTLALFVRMLALLTSATVVSFYVPTWAFFASTPSGLAGVLGVASAVGLVVVVLPVPGFGDQFD